MKKYFVIGNPIKHSLSPLLHNYWIRKKNIEAVYEKKKIDDEDLKNLIYLFLHEKLLILKFSEYFYHLSIFEVLHTSNLKIMV